MKYSGVVYELERQSLPQFRGRVGDFVQRGACVNTGIADSCLRVKYRGAGSATTQVLYGVSFATAQ